MWVISVFLKLVVKTSLRSGPSAFTLVLYFKANITTTFVYSINNILCYVALGGGHMNVTERYLGGRWLTPPPPSKIGVA